MKFDRKFAVVTLIIFFGLALSVVCFASAQASMMEDCGGGHEAALCPYMSISIPAVTRSALVSKEIAFAIAALVAFSVSALTVLMDGRMDAFLSALPGRGIEGGPPVAADPVHALISRGIIHSRIYA